METLAQDNFPKLEQPQFDYELMFLEDQLQRSLEIPLLPTISSSETNDWTYNLPNETLIQYPPPPLLTHQDFINNNEIISQSIENHKIIEDFHFNIEDDFHLWNESLTPLCEDAWKPLAQLPPTTIPCTFDNNNNPKPPTTTFDQNDDKLSLLNNTNNLLNDYYLNDQTLSTIVSDGSNNMGSLNSNFEDDNFMFSSKIKTNNNIKVPKIEAIHYEEIRKYFDMPISRAAKELNVGLTVLKKRCRELNIKRWPHRKIKSLEALISNVKELGMMEVVQVLEEHKRKLHCVPGLELTEETKKLRQACFKANYKKRRATALAITQH